MLLRNSIQIQSDGRVDWVDGDIDTEFNEIKILAQNHSLCSLREIFDTLGDGQKMEQSLQVMSKQERLENWTARIMACRSSGMTVRAWCRENGLSEKTYYYWQRRLFQALSEQQTVHQTAFAEVTPPQLVCSGKVAVTVRIAGAEADIHSGADAATVETVLRILKSC